MTAGASRVGTTFGKYQITRLLGRGGMGEVYEAYDTSKDRTVALKILLDHYSGDERFRTRFQRESRATAMLREPHVIPIHDWGEIDGSLYIDMRLIQGATLQELIRRGPMPPQRAVALIVQVAAALDAAHAHDLIHRDVKPQNIIVTPADFVYLVDFGIAAMPGESSLTATGTQIGSVAHMAPERFTDKPVGSAVDVYALACILYEMLTGRTPFPTGSIEQTISAHMSAAPPRPSQTDPRIPAALDQVIAQGMAKDPAHRFRTAGALGEAAQRALQPAAPAAPFPAPPPAGAPFANPGAPTAAFPTAASAPVQSAPPVALSAPTVAAPEPAKAHWTGYAALAAALLALTVAVAGLFVPKSTGVAPEPSDDSTASGVASTAFSASEISAAKHDVCTATDVARSAVQLNTNMTNPEPGNVIGDLAVGTNARLALAHSSDYLRMHLAAAPATPADLAVAATGYADTLSELAMGYLAGRTPDDEVQQPLRDKLIDQLDTLVALCD
ncbi:serine/threonine-protein kinase [[Mycobacterium] kokjensenii]|uniref:non-specific serine/threonine protein kinase n=1 Tax=[Mycobacterium] kokjensenii TaxID=3064287 RepID=A0ABM9LV81_9MYCO|nr:serine/threonine-protein kinase [Mycolicibacter sp. MU0083]CAJ1505296.1 serine/threonine-protein kinase [Mycolicibacter sp. MU0083]